MCYKNGAGVLLVWISCRRREALVLSFSTATQGASYL
jgi:hypothetical protein